MTDPAAHPSSVWPQIVRSCMSPYRQLLAATVFLVVMSALVCEKSAVLLSGLFAVYCWLLWSIPTFGHRLAGPAEQRPRWTMRQMLVVTACLGTMISVLVHDWPFRVRFALSQAAIEEVADRVERGGAPSGPVRAGLFWIRQAEQCKRSGYMFTCLWTDPDPSGPTGFVRCKPRDTRFFNLWTTTQMTDDWQFVSED